MEEDDDDDEYGHCLVKGCVCQIYCLCETASGIEQCWCGHNIGKHEKIEGLLDNQMQGFSD